LREDLIDDSWKMNYPAVKILASCYLSRKQFKFAVVGQIGADFAESLDSGDKIGLWPSLRKRY